MELGTAELYATIIDTYIVPHIGTARLQEIEGSHLNDLHGILGTSGRKNGKLLAAKTIRNVHTLLHRAFRDAVKWELLIRNPADAADPPKVARPQPRYWTAEQVAAFLAATLTIGSARCGSRSRRPDAGAVKPSHSAGPT